MEILHKLSPLIIGRAPPRTVIYNRPRNQGPVPITDTMCYSEISQRIEAVRFESRIVWSLYNLAGTSAALLPKCLSNFTAMRLFKLPNLRLQVFTRFYDKNIMGYWYRPRLVCAVSLANNECVIHGCTIVTFIINIVLHIQWRGHICPVCQVKKYDVT